MITPGSYGAMFSAQMWTGACLGLFGCGESVERAGCPHGKREFSGVASGHFRPSGGVLLLAIPPLGLSFLFCMLRASCLGPAHPAEDCWDL